MTSSEQHPSKITTKTGHRSQWFRISQNGLPNALVGFILLRWTRADARAFSGKRSNDSDTDEEGVKKSKVTAPEIKLRTDSRGYPMLPSWKSIKDTDLIYKKYLIGRYLSDMYRA
jgi:hypothetical protein